MNAIGILLTNTGSPAAPSPQALRPYLAEFLSDRRVIALPPWLWRPVLHAFVLPFRPSRSAQLYRNIWTPAGSPLIFISNRLEEKFRIRLEERVGSGIHTAAGMRYGAPSIFAALERLQERGVRRLLVFPLFPQYSRTTTESAFDAVQAACQALNWDPETRLIQQYHSHPAYLDALVASIRGFWQENGEPEKLLFSFHGIPEMYERAGDPYAAHCRATAQSAAQRLGLGDGDWSISFQSRFGPVRWLQPYTDRVLAEWGRRGPRHVHVVSPGFSIDCLETLDELGREGQNIFLEAGGKRFEYIPALNDRRAHVEALLEIALQELTGWGDPVANHKRNIDGHQHAT